MGCPVARAESVNDIALELAMLKAIADHVRKLESIGKTSLANNVLRGMVYAQLGPEDLATISIVSDRQVWQVVDEKKFVEWVKKNRPTAIVESVRKSDQDDLLAKIEKTGEVPDGVELGTATGYVSVKQTDEQKERLLTAVRDKRLGTFAQMVGIES